MHMRLIKNGHTYLIRSGLETAEITQEIIRCWAGSNKLNFSWHDAANVNGRIRLYVIMCAKAGVFTDE